MCDCSKNSITESELNAVLAGGGLQSSKVYYNRMLNAAKCFKNSGFTEYDIYFYYNKPLKSLNFCPKISFVESENYILLQVFN